ncbi:MAG: PD-(D/E)XK nuclease family protein [Pirellulaceae bacterium]
MKWLASLCNDSLLTEKWLLVEDLRVAQQWKDRLCLAGYSTINLHSKTLRSLAVSLVGNILAIKKQTFIGGAAMRMIVHGLVSELLESKELAYFSNVHSIDGLADLMTQSIRDLRLAELNPNSLKVKAFESAIKARDVKRVFEAYCSRLDDKCLADYASCIELANRSLVDGSIELPPGLLVLVPEKLKLTAAEQRLLETIGKRSTICRPNQLESFSDETARKRIGDHIANGVAKFEFFAGHGEVNEIRGMLQRILSQKEGGPHSFDDVEILHTDYHQYVPLLVELLSTWLARSACGENSANSESLPSVDALPITFAEGIACVYSRPGRALRGWLRWARHDFVESKAVQLLREGLLARPDSAAQIGYARLASTLRKMPIGFKLERYLPKIEEAITHAQQCQAEYLQRDRESPESSADEPDRDFGLPALKALQEMVLPLVRLAPQANDTAALVLEKARQFLLQCARADNQLDRYARGKLLDDICSMSSTLELTMDTDLDVWQWLEELPLESRILASGPQPGCLHMAPLSQGGHSGRRLIFVVGLDDGRYPKRAAIDPILLDAERDRLSDHLQTSQESEQRQQQSLYRALFRVLDDGNAKVHLSYSSQNLVQDRSLFPSTAMLEVYRVTSSNEDAHMDDLLNHIGPAASFVSEHPDDHLDVSDVDLARLLLEPNEFDRRQLLEAEFSHMAHCRIASELQAASPLGEYDGWVPEAGVELDPTASGWQTSPSRLETFGTCPRRYFFKYGLGVYPPDEWDVDPEKWLDAFQFGNLVHELFEDFLRCHTQNELIPNLARDLKPLREMLFNKIEQLKSDIPIPNEDAFQRQCDVLEDVCEIFLRKEEEYCRVYAARPWVLEASIGLNDEPKTELDCSEPIGLTLSDGRVIQVGGRIDRVDRLLLNGSERYAIWDYKSGSDLGFSQDDPFQLGRKLQPFLYVGMLRHRIAATGGKPDSVATFGYFFPTPRTEGRRLQWTYGELKRGDEILRHICNLIKTGVFVATTDPADCKSCDFVPVCRYPDFVAAESLQKALQPGNKKFMQPWVQLRGLDQNAGMGR